MFHLLPTLNERDQRDRMLRVRGMWNACDRCELASTRTRVVHWRGSITGRLGVIGEGPGESEDREGLPFVGKAGKLLDELLAECGLESADFFIANIVGCRPPKNREPTRDEVLACRPRLDAMLAFVKPRALLLLGNTPLEHLAGKRGVSKLRGEEVQAKLRWRGEPYFVPAVPTFHPAFLLRTHSTEARARVLEDIRAAGKLAGVYL
jgi:DNA polymerase